MPNSGLVLIARDTVFFVAIGEHKEEESDEKK